jgi:ornithine carbamoyltransferase
MARVFSHEHLEAFAVASPIPVINGLSDRSHPCQALADVLTVYEHFGNLRGLRAAWVGDSNNVAFSFAEACARFGISLAIASPEGYQFDENKLEALSEMGLQFDLLNDAHAAVRKANVIYTDTWTSMGQEAEAEQRRKIFPPYQVNRELLADADRQAIVLHCLPAHRGEEITDDVADGPQSRLFQQAANRLHAQKAVLVSLMSGNVL